MTLRQDFERRQIADMLEDAAEEVMPKRELREFRKLLAKLRKGPKQRRLPL